MSSTAKSPIRISPKTVHFWVSQLGWNEWFMNLDKLPLGPASMIRLVSNVMKWYVSSPASCLALRRRRNSSLSISSPTYSTTKSPVLISALDFSPQPFPPVLNVYSGGYCRFWKRRFLHKSPPTHTAGWHSNCNILNVFKILIVIESWYLISFQV